MPAIDAYQFGRMTIDGRDYTKDLIIYPDGAIRENWWRLSGHFLMEYDIRDLLAADVQVLVVGTGASGMMRMDQKLIALLENRGIELIAESTARAMKDFNTLYGQKRVGACFHLTC